MSVDISRTFEAALVRQCAPTLAGMKPGSIFCFKRFPPEALRRKTSQWNEQLAPFGLAVRILLERPDSGSAIVYVYRPKHLARILSSHAYRRFLSKAGYEDADLDGLLEQLAHRLRTQPEFPHDDFFVVGIAKGYEDAVEMVEEITQEVYNKTKGADIRSYILEREQEE